MKPLKLKQALLKEDVPPEMKSKLKRSLSDSLTYLGYYGTEDKSILLLQKSIEDFMNKNGM